MSYVEQKPCDSVARSQTVQDCPKSLSHKDLRRFVGEQ